MDMYADDLISRQELNDKIGGSRKEIERLENELKMVSYHLTKGEQLESVLNHTFKEIEDITDVREMTNTQLKRIIQKIEVDKEGNVEIFLRLFGDLGLEEAVLIEDKFTTDATVLNNNNHTNGDNYIEKLENLFDDIYGYRKTSEEDENIFNDAKPQPFRLPDKKKTFSWLSHDVSE